MFSHVCFFMYETKKKKQHPYIIYTIKKWSVIALIIPLRLIINSKSALSNGGSRVICHT